MSRINLINRIQTEGKLYKTLALINDLDFNFIELYNASGTTIANFQNDINYLSGQTNTKLGITPFKVYSGNTANILKNKFQIFEYANDEDRPDYVNPGVLGWYNLSRQCSEYWNGSEWIQLTPNDVNLTGITTQQFNVYTGSTQNTLTTLQNDVNFVSGKTANNISTLNLYINPNQTIVTGSTSGTSIFSQPQNSTNLKSVLIYCNSLLGTATYIFPTPFIFIPDKLGSHTSLITSLSTTSITVSGNTSSGFIQLYGF